eukprot:TRINITY_DN41090_c0_g1_i3.p1 TRINITY_DN41090_c0_g1~~TRINITY_DN41090_c0_g1_i3.p1  ORF type:complete len:130 (-),score=25.56 TRINITY_DN41090_c0_g1_i3:20-409(-)
MLHYYDHFDALDPKGTVALSSETHVKCTTDKPSSGYQFSFTISNPKDERAFTFAARTAEDRKSWMESLKQATNSDKIEIETLDVKEKEELGGTLDQSKIFSPLSSLSGGEIGRAVQQECRDRSRMPSSA